MEIFVEKIKNFKTAFRLYKEENNHFYYEDESKRRLKAEKIDSDSITIVFKYLPKDFKKDCGQEKLFFRIREGNFLINIEKIFLRYGCF